MNSKLQYHLTGHQISLHMLNVNPEIHLCGMTDSARLPFYLPVHDACTVNL